MPPGNLRSENSDQLRNQLPPPLLFRATISALASQQPPVGPTVYPVAHAHQDVRKDTETNLPYAHVMGVTSYKVIVIVLAIFGQVIR